MATHYPTVSLVTTSSNTLSTSGNIYYNATTGGAYVSTGTHWQPLTTYTTTAATFTWNGDPAQAGSRIFKSVEEQTEYQQQAYVEPRDHAYNPQWDDTCQDCFAHNIHRYEAEKHLYVVEEEIDWCDRLAS